MKQKLLFYLLLFIGLPKVSLAKNLTENGIPLKWIGDTPAATAAVSFGIPFGKGEVTDPGEFLLSDGSGKELLADSWELAYWPDGSVKWAGFAAVVPGNTDRLFLLKGSGRSELPVEKIAVKESDVSVKVNTGIISLSFPKQGSYLVDSILYGKQLVGKSARLVCKLENRETGNYEGTYGYSDYSSKIKNVTVERAGNVRVLVKVEGYHRNDSRKWLPFVVRFYLYKGSDQVKIVHTIVYDGDQESDFIRGLGIEFGVPLREQLYNRHVAFSGNPEGVWSEPVQPLHGRRVLSLNGDRTLYEQQIRGKRIPEYEMFDSINRNLIDHWACWDGFRLSQLTSDAFTVRKRANSHNPWIGTRGSDRSRGLGLVGDVSGGLAVCLENFWQSYPASIEINGARSEEARLTMWLWSPEAEAMDLRHYDDVAHDLNASYEDVQEGLSTPYGVARTSVLRLQPLGNYPGKAAVSMLADALSDAPQLVCTPEYLHSKRAFGVWSLPDRSTPLRRQLEERLDNYIDYYREAIATHRWYGFWNYGDIMHSYDPVRHEWRYDIGGFAWHNTELAPNMWLWYNFLRSGRKDIWKMAEAMTRHTAEVDVYHIGEYAGLGTRHNVSHWGCGAKEARVSQAAWNRFYYYLTTDERTGDLMKEVADADHKLYTLDPMRLAQPREKYPSTAPARLRVGPDWIAYAGNWLTEWERTGNSYYRDKIIAGMKSIAALPNGLFTGPGVLGYYPETGVVTYEGDPELQNTNHLMTIMGGFEIMQEIMEMVEVAEWKAAWADHAARYTSQARRIKGNAFLVPKLTAYGALHYNDEELARQAWKELLRGATTATLPTFDLQPLAPAEGLEPFEENPAVSSNGAATWSIDAIYMLEVLSPDKEVE